MELKEIITNTFKELILPELGRIKEENKEIKNRRLDDVNIHLADQSRRINETNKRIDSVREELNARIDSVREELNKRIDETNKRIDETNKRLDRLYEVIVRRNEHVRLEECYSVRV